ncbi:hypothetical protein [Desulfocapsa sulfexigens]|uniref:hypothetical protein n=1 Tax=Desulfocapsa sulfexigens TaxID=65555 RepID=UPI0012948314|nr:hypothetical protein [Desulfocapsa sulfexigens]
MPWNYWPESSGLGGRIHWNTQAKEKGRRSDNYQREYVGDSKVVEIETDADAGKVCRIEFSLHGKATIKRVLKIENISEISSSKEVFLMLQNRYLKIPEIDQKKLEQIMFSFYRSKEKSKLLSRMITSYGLLRAWLDNSKEAIKMGKKLRRFQRKANLSARQTRSIEKELLASRTTDYFRR